MTFYSPHTLTGKLVFSLILILLPILNQAQCVSGNCTEGYGMYKFEAGGYYEGDWIQGERSGYGFCEYANGETYEGHWEKNNRHGFGSLVMKDGSIYSGFFKDNQTHYWGSYFWTNGDYYIGLFKNGNRANNGVYVFASGKWRILNESVDYEAKGPVIDTDGAPKVYVYDNGGVYGGFSKDSKSHYWGAFHAASADVEAGKEHFYFGRINGPTSEVIGARAQADGRLVVTVPEFNWEETGCVAGNCQDGFGVYVHPNGDVYSGFWKKSKRHHFGSYYWAKGESYTGLWKDDVNAKTGLYIWSSDKFEFMTPETSDKKEN